MTSSLIQPELPQRRQEVLEIILESDKIVIPVLGSEGKSEKLLTGVILHPLEGVSEPFGVHFLKFYFVG